MKRTGPIRRKSPLKKVGKQKVKRQKRYAAYLKSRDWAEKRRAVRERSGGRCERVVVVTEPRYGDDGAVRWERVAARCSFPAHTCNHRGYGVGRLEDVPIERLEDLCKRHNELWTSQHNANFMGR